MSCLLEMCKFQDGWKEKTGILGKCQLNSETPTEFISVLWLNLCFSVINFGSRVPILLDAHILFLRGDGQLLLWFVLNTHCTEWNKNTLNMQ